MNHCLLEVKVQKAPQTRYTKENNTPIAEMEVTFEGLRSDDPLGTLKVVGWGKIAQEMQSGIQAGNRLIVEGRLRMNTIARQDGTKEKLAELTLSKMHTLGTENSENGPTKESNISISAESQGNPSKTDANSKGQNTTWDASPLVPDIDEIPF